MASELNDSDLTRRVDVTVAPPRPCPRLRYIEIEMVVHGCADQFPPYLNNQKQGQKKNLEYRKCLSRSWVVSGRRGRDGDTVLTRPTNRQRVKKRKLASPNLLSLILF